MNRRDESLRRKMLHETVQFLERHLPQPPHSGHVNFLPCTIIDTVACDDARGGGSEGISRGEPRIASERLSMVWMSRWLSAAVILVAVMLVVSQNAP